ncbi:MAG TPA: TPM domain-containing protein [Steroidobacteraceae bacterium]|nr:TPM domain-containing protein [Steroidobacteraceae bacterium]
MLRHLSCTHAGTRALFTPAVLAQIERACAESQATHLGEIRFAIETALPFAALWHDVTPRERAVRLFGHLHLWDTHHSNGVLIYVLRADRAVEIVADRGVSAHVAPEEWQAVCREMQSLYRDGHYAEGSVAGVTGVARLLARHFPSAAAAAAAAAAVAPSSQLPIQPVLL